MSYKNTTTKKCLFGKLNYIFKFSLVISLVLIRSAFLSMTFLQILRRIFTIFHKIGRFPFTFNNKKTSNQLNYSKWSIIYTIILQLFHQTLSIYLTIHYYNEFFAINYGTSINIIRKISISINFSSIWLNNAMLFIIMLKNHKCEMKLLNTIMMSSMKIISIQKQKQLATNFGVLSINVGIYFVILSILSFNYWNQKFNLVQSIVYGVIQESGRSSIMIQALYCRFVCECIFVEIDKYIFDWPKIVSPKMVNFDSVYEQKLDFSRIFGVQVIFMYNYYFLQIRWCVLRR